MSSYIAFELRAHALFAEESAHNIGPMMERCARDLSAVRKAKADARKRRAAA